MREAVFRTNVTKYIGLAATLLLLGLFFRWNLNQTVTVYAENNSFQDSANNGTAVQGIYSFSDNETEGGYTLPDSQTGITLYYQIYDRDKKEVYISGYKYDGSYTANNRVELYLPAKIRHGYGTDRDDGSGSDSDGNKTGGDGDEYTVVGVNGSVFKNFAYLSSVTFPKTGTYEWIGQEAFAGCPLTGVTLSEGLKEIRDMAFYGCSQLQQVEIPRSVNLIGTGVFANCERLQVISVLSGNQKYCADYGILYSVNKDVLIQYPAGKSMIANTTDGVYQIGSNSCQVRMIGDRAFEGCKFTCSTIGIYETVTAIGDYAFYGCTNLSRVKIPSSVQTIGQYAFSNCFTGLVIECHKASRAETFASGYGIATSITCTVNFYDSNKLVKTEEVPAGGSASAPVLTERPGYTLTWDKDYTNVQQNLNVYSSWKQNYTVTFKDSYSGQVMQVASYFGGSVTPPAWTREGYILGWDTTAYTYVTKDLTVNAVWLISMTGGDITEEKPQVGDTRTINNITYQVTRASVSDPRVKAVGCTKQTLTSLVIPDTITFGGVTYKVTNIGANAFRDMPKLTKLEIGKYVVKINRAAFYNCPKLKTITIHSKRLTGVAAKAFSKIYVKAKINVPNAYIKKYKTLLLDGGLSTYAKVY